MMKKKLLVVSTFLVFLTMPVFSYAVGDITAGKDKAASCVSCHGEDGNSLVSTFPKLAGQHAGYLANQLNAFKQGLRESSIMAPLAMGLDDQSIQDIAVFYASLKMSTNQRPVIDPDSESDNVEDLVVLGSDLYRNGNLKTTVSACTACHGSSAEGNKPGAFPVLAGQHADYLIKSLTDFKKGFRDTQQNSMMHMIAKKMSDKEIQAVSYYLSMF